MTRILPSKIFWNRRSKIILLENLELYISSGLTIQDALKTAVHSLSSKQQVSLRNVSFVVDQGGLFSSALAQYINFSSTLSALISHGERAGSFRESLLLARTIMEREDALIKTCLSSLMYPLIIGIFALVLTLVLMTWVMPQIIPLLRSLNISLPVLTRVVIYTSDHLISYWLYILCFVFLTIFTGTFLYMKFFSIQSISQHVFIRIPIIGSLYRLYTVSLIARSLGGLIMSGTTVTYAYSCVSEKIYFTPLRVHFIKKIDDIHRGIPLSSIFSSLKKVPAYVSPLVSAGEVSGNLGSSLMRVSDLIDRDIEHLLKRVTSLIEPLMMIGVGCIIGGVALSILMPIYEVSKVLQH